MSSGEYETMYVRSSLRQIRGVESDHRTDVFWNKCFTENRGSKAILSLTREKGEGKSLGGGKEWRKLEKNFQESVIK